MWNKKIFSYSSKYNDSMKHCSVCVCHYSKSTWICIYYYFIEIPHIDFFSLFQIIFFFAVIACATNSQNSQKRCTEHIASTGEEKQIYFCACHSCMTRASEREFSRQEISWWKGKKCWFLFTNGAKISLSSLRLSAA